MKDETINDIENEKQQEIEEIEKEVNIVSSKFEGFFAECSTPIGGMFKKYFLDYASYVNLERAVPHIADGLKPVQRRILHSMKRIDDGRFNKVANIIGHTMQFHPHGDRSIGDALVNMGQKELLVDTQGNWGNIHTGDSAAAPRYIESRLSKFALEVLFSPKVTQWKQSYDGRNNEPVAFPVKFPLLLIMDVQGIGVGMASRILPHNFNEIIDASVSYLKKEDFELYPDFITGGMVDVSRYNDGIRGGIVKIRAKINIIDSKTISITEIPFGCTTQSVIDSIIKQNESGKIKIKKIDDNTAENVEIIIQLASGISPENTIDALYAFTDCQISLSPNSCVIYNNKPIFIGVKEILKRSVDNTLEVLKNELIVKKGELENEWHFATLEKIFIENRIYKDKEFEESKDNSEAFAHILKRLEPFKAKLKREITEEDLLKLLEIRMARILRYNENKAEESIVKIEAEIKKITNNIEHIVKYTIDYYTDIKNKFGKNRVRRTEIKGFENIEATRVVVANEKLYINRVEGFIGTSLRNDEYVSDCSDIDDIIVFFEDGKFKVLKVAPKIFIGKNILYTSVFKKNNENTIYNLIYRDGKHGNVMVKRFSVVGITRDKDYDLTMGTPDSKILYFTANPRGEAEIIRVILKPKPKLKKITFDFDFSTIIVKGRSSQGNILSKNAVHKIKLKEEGSSTLSDQKLWYNPDVSRINNEGRGKYIGSFSFDDKVIVFSNKGVLKVYEPDLNARLGEDLFFIGKFIEGLNWTLVYWDDEKKTHYMKRFTIDSDFKEDRFLDSEKDKIIILNSNADKINITFGGKHKTRDAETFSVEEFITVKGVQAKGKRLSNYEVADVQVIEKPEPEPDVSKNDNKIDIFEPKELTLF